MPSGCKICLDIDGVLADFVGEAGRLMGYDPAVVDTWDYYHKVGETEDTFWEKIDAAGAEFWAEMQPYPWAHDLFDLCKLKGETILLTTNSKHHKSAEGKVLWMQKHFGRSFRNYLIGPKKEFCARPGTILIDDSDANCEKFIANGGSAILFPRSWNEARRHADAAYQHVAVELIRH